MTRFDSLGKFILLILISQFNFGQNQYQPQKSPATKIVLDGILSSDEWENATPIELNYEINPGNNSPAKKGPWVISPILIPIYTLRFTHSICLKI